MKILMITSIYPIPDVKIMGSTSVCHYFAKEWIKQGHEVVVVNTYTIYPRILHWLSQHMEKLIVDKFPVSINTVRFSKPMQYELDNVKVLLTPTYKKFPKSDFPSSSIEKTADEISVFLNQTGFTPDIVATHFLHPNLELIPLIKKRFPNITCGISLHGQMNSPKNIAAVQDAKDVIDFWGFRSNPIADSFRKNCFMPEHSLYCFSGVPQSYIKPDSFQKHNHLGVSKFIFVGNLIRRKHPIEVLKSLVCSGIDFSLEYVGTGKQSKEIQNIIKDKDIESKVKLLGRLPREAVSQKMQDAECFIMISEDETFGLVYLEAMANGCIVIASRNEGMQGIIRDGENGFLCEAGNKDELADIITKINNLSANEKIEISKNAIATATRMTDIKVAQDYLNSLIDISNSHKA